MWRRLAAVRPLCRALVTGTPSKRAQPALLRQLAPPRCQLVAGSTLPARAAATGPDVAKEAEPAKEDQPPKEGSEEGEQAKEPEAEQGEADAAAEATPEEPAAAAAEAAEEEVAPEVLLQREAAALREKLQAKKHDLLLALADFENSKKRCMREREVRRRGAMGHFARSMLNVYDELVSLASAVHSEDASGPQQALGEGVTLTRDLCKASLERFGVEPFSPELGQPIVMARHENVGSVEAEGLAANSVAELVEPGWLLEPGSNSPVVLRKARVKVARQGPEVPPAPAE